MAKRRFRPRKEFKFWLYRDLMEDIKLMEYIEFLRKTRQFATKLRQGLRLMWTLGEGDLSYFFELFPTMRAQFKPNTSELVEEFRQMLQQNLVTMALPAQTQQGLKPMSAPQIAMPIFDDDDDEQDTVVIRRDPNAGGAITNNFLDSVFGLQGKGDGQT